MKALVLITAALGVTLLVFWFAREQMSSRVDPTPPFVAQLERFVEEGVLGGETPSSLVATLVLAGPFREGEPWDTAPRRRSMMNAWFGEPRQYSFMEALLREPRSVGWRTDAAGPAELAGAEEQVIAAARWAEERGVRLRVIAHGAMLGPVLRAALAVPPDSQVFERVLGVGLSLADLKAKDPVLAQALAERPAPVGQWFDIYSDPAVVPRVLVLERVGPGPEASAEPLAWPGSSWVSTVVQVSERGAPRREVALPAAAPGSQLSARQFRSVKDGRVTQRVVDGKGNLVTGSLIVPKLDKEEVPPDPEAGEKDKMPEVIAVKDTGWNFRVPKGMTPAHADFSKCQPCMLLQDYPFSMSLDVDRKPNFPGAAKMNCSKGGGTLVQVQHKGYPAEVCKGISSPSGLWDYFTLHGLGFRIELSYTYTKERRDEKLDLFMRSIQALEPPAAK